MTPGSARALRGGTIAVGVALLAVLGAGAILRRTPPTETIGATPAPTPVSPAASTGAPRVASRPDVPLATATPVPVASGGYLFAPGEGPVVGAAGTLRRYRVAVEVGVAVSVAEFTGLVDTTLADPRSWIAGHDVRLQRAPAGASSVSFTVSLVSPGTAKAICGAAGYDIVLHGEPYTSCRVGDRVVINLNRYLYGVPGYGAPIDVYRQYAINHEVGHALGHGHELCPGPGRPAPVMQQQTFGLQGCVANGWPYLDGRRYAGSPTG